MFAVTKKGQAIVFVVVAGLVMGCAFVGRKADQADIERTKKGEAAMATMLSSRTLSVSIACPLGKVYEFLSNPENFPKWAKGLGKSVRKDGADWIVDTPQGPMNVLRGGLTDFSVLHRPLAPDPAAGVSAPLRVLSN